LTIIFYDERAGSTIKKIDIKQIIMVLKRGSFAL